MTRSALTLVVALLLPVSSTGCGTVINLFGCQNTEEAVKGPDKGRVVVIRQAAIYGGLRQDISFLFTQRTLTRVFAIPLCFELVCSFALDTLLLPMTIPLNHENLPRWPAEP
jgi:hypothetical protein